MNSMKTITFKPTTPSNQNPTTKINYPSNQNPTTENQLTNHPETNNDFHQTKLISQVTNDPDIDEYTTDIW